MSDREANAIEPSTKAATPEATANPDPTPTASGVTGSAAAPAEDFASLFAASESATGRVKIEVGDLISGRVVSVGRTTAFITVGAKGEAEIDLATAHRDLVKIEQEIQVATRKHNEFLKELGLSLIPYGEPGKE